MMKPAVCTKVVESLIRVCINSLVLSTRKELEVYFVH
jgi:hypothetical protein